MQRIGRTKVEAFFLEFSFLERYIDQLQVLKVRVRRMDESLFAIQGNWRDRRPFFDYFAVTPISRLLLLDRAGNLLARAGYRARYRNPNHRWWKFWERKWLKELADAKPEMVWASPKSEETIEDCFAAMPQAQRAKVCYAALYQTTYGGATLTLYKLPKGVANIDSWIALQLAASRAEIQQQCEEIDAEAEEQTA